MEPSANWSNGLQARALAQRHAHTRADMPRHAFVVTLQPVVGSVLAEKLRSGRDKCEAAHGADETFMHPLHVPVTGFFMATNYQAQDVCTFLTHLAEGAGPDSLVVEIVGGVTTQGGDVLLTTRAPGIASLAKALSAKVRPHGVFMRPKDVNQLVLASSRSSNEQESICELFRDLPAGPCAFDIVVSRLRKPAATQSKTGVREAYEHEELLRLCLPSCARPVEAAPMVQEIKRADSLSTCASSSDLQTEDPYSSSVAGA
eukprot:gnl/TRDRNA2_/TRDRNA2_28013_c0_seq1.p1 gnl/TRDRNA2_/TRDRNA2_28013_c0~~gnl/TRDRNA2_/TRDRNA2_28013_c0_seq1.p1  ORF type:complete len:259 (+),score=46.27 gnl/TRDRNA2_/TRDRNA2_28013_c0_seq1:83-859(+)